MPVACHQARKIEVEAVTATVKLVLQSQVVALRLHDQKNRKESNHGVAGEWVGPCSPRTEQRQWVRHYVDGLLSPVERMNNWKLAEPFDIEVLAPAH
jgi:hypothetical protein